MILVLSIFEWPLKTGFTVALLHSHGATHITIELTVHCKEITCETTSKEETAELSSF